MKIRNANCGSEEVVHLNIGGSQKMTVRKGIFFQIEGCLLSDLFQNTKQMKKVDNKIFIDRDPRTFQVLLNFLRDGDHLT